METQFMGRPRHRLFAIFDDPTVGQEAVEKLRTEGHEGDNVWVFYGEEGTRRIDITGDLEGIRGRIIRTVEHAMSGDIGYFRILDEALRSGGLVIAVSVADADAADQLARLLRSCAAHSFAYFSNWEFQPVNVGPAP